MADTKVVIVEAGRTPSGKHMGAFRDIPSENLLAECYKWVIVKSGIDPNLIDEIIASNCYTKSSAPNVAHVAARLAGLPQKIPAWTPMQNCGSGTRAIIAAYQVISAGDAEIILVGGAENMSEVPRYEIRSRLGQKFGNIVLVDSLTEGLADSLAIDETTRTKALYWQIAENTIRKHKISREDQDRFAIRSHKNAYRATIEGLFRPRMVPILNRTTDETINTALIKNEQIAGGFPDLLGHLFQKDGGTVTPLNSSQVSDGAAALLVTTESCAKALGLQPLAEIIAYASVGGDPLFMGELPVLAIQETLAKAGLSAQDVDVVQLNEAFSGQTIACIKQLPFTEDQFNPLGGAIALGHPIGASGIMRTVDAITIFEHTDARYIMIAFCIGGGQGIAMLLKRADALPNKTAISKQKTLAIGTVGVVGSAGTMGHGIHVWLARQGIPSVMCEETPELAQVARQKFDERLDRYVLRGIISGAEADHQKSLVSSVSDLEGLKDCDLVIEAAPEKMELKKRIFRGLDREMKPNAVLATNSSSLSITELGAATGRPGQTIGIHFFNPAWRIPLVEINIGKETASEVADGIEQFVRERLQKTPVRVQDSPGFYVNRALAPLLLEGVYGISRTDTDPKAIDECMKQFGWPATGCFWLLDMLGFPLVREVLDVLHGGFGERMANPRLMDTMVAEGRKGENWGAGFYDYSPQQKIKSLDEILRANFPDRIKGDPEKIFRLMMYQFVNESVRCLEEGIISLNDIGTASCLGIGFPLAKENPLKWADEEGLEKIVATLDAMREETKDPRYEVSFMLREHAKNGKTFFSSLQSIVW